MKSQFRLSGWTVALAVVALPRWPATCQLPWCLFRGEGSVKQPPDKHSYDLVRGLRAALVREEAKFYRSMRSMP